MGLIPNLCQFFMTKIIFLGGGEGRIKGNWEGHCQVTATYVIANDSIKA